MKTIYIPKGETVHYDTVNTDRLVVRGFLDVSGSVKAKTISGGGTLAAGSVSADTICLGDLETSYTVCEKLICKRAESAELFASKSIAASCFLSAAHVETGKLTVALSEIDEIKADEVVNLPSKKRGLFRTLLASALRSLWSGLVFSMFCSSSQDRAPQAIPVESEETPKTAPAGLDHSTPAQVTEPVDIELNRIIGLFNLLRDQGYTLRVVPGTPEENAPVFDLEQERILRKAA